MVSEEFSELVGRGIQECEEGNTLLALMYLEKASRAGRTPELNSYLGYCLAKERKSYRDGISLCSAALKEQPGNLLFYRNLAKTYIAANQKKNAMKILREATKRGRDEGVMQLIKDLGIRTEPVLSFLPRSNPLNIFLGKIRYRFFG